ncbi:MAG: hypothetical protein LBI42_08150 [Chitinispirillales bacterium]|jgi:hypothetical protein|nr:hypothetical protein [Chitinispirillales bacterium]
MDISIMGLNVNILSLAVGFATGLIATCVLWAVIGLGGKKKLKKQKNEREQIMFSIGELIADADNISANFRCGSLSEEMFRRGLNDKVREITRQFRSNMHLLDVFFSKYADMQISQYIAVLENPERRAQKAEVDAPAAARAAVSQNMVIPDVPPVQTVVPLPEKEPGPGVEETAQSPVAAEFGKAEEKPQANFKSFETREELGALPAAQSAQAAAPQVPVIDYEERSPEQASSGYEPFGSIEESRAPQAQPIYSTASETPAVEQLPYPDGYWKTADRIEETGAGTQPSAPSAPQAQDNEEVFELPIAQSAAQSEPDEVDSWAEQSFEEYEAGFAQFEEQQIEKETGDFPINEVTAQSNMPAMPGAASEIADEEEFVVDQKYVQPDTNNDQVFTETICMDRPQYLQPVPPQFPPQTQAPPPPLFQAQPPIMQQPPLQPSAQAPIMPQPFPTPLPPAQAPLMSQAAPQQPAFTQPSAPAAGNIESDDGITGDDVMDSIDNFFNLK